MAAVPTIFVNSINFWLYMIAIHSIIISSVPAQSFSHEREDISSATGISISLIDNLTPRNERYLGTSSVPSCEPSFVTSAEVRMSL